MYMFENPFSYVANPSRSQAVGLAKMYFGLPDLDPSVEANQVQVYVVQPCGCDDPYLAISQPVRTSAGGVPVYNGTPVQLALDVDVYSLSIKSSSDAHIYYTPRVVRPDNELRDALADGTADIGGQTAQSVADLVVKSKVASLEQLKAMTVTANFVGYTVDVNSYYSGQVLGAGSWLIVLTSSVTPNNIDIVQSASNALISYVLQTQSPFNAYSFGASAATGASARIQRAINRAQAEGVPIVEVGSFVHDSQILIKSGVTLSSIGYKFGPRFWGGGSFTGWQYTTLGAVISVKFGSGSGASNDYTKAGFLLESGSAIKGFAAYYPDQVMTASTPTEYGPLIATQYRAGTGSTDAATEDTFIEDINLGNAYVGIDARRAHSQLKIQRINGYPLYRGVRIGSTEDNDFVKDVHFARLNAFRGTIASYEPMLNYVNNNAMGLEIGRTSWSEFSNIFCFGYRNTVYAYYQDATLNPEYSRSGGVQSGTFENIGGDLCKYTAEFDNKNQNGDVVGAGVELHWGVKISLMSTPAEETSGRPAPPNLGDTACFVWNGQTASGGNKWFDAHIRCWGGFGQIALINGARNGKLFIEGYNWNSGNSTTYAAAVVLNNTENCRIADGSFFDCQNRSNSYAILLQSNNKGTSICNIDVVDFERNGGGVIINNSSNTLYRVKNNTFTTTNTSVIGVIDNQMDEKSQLSGNIDSNNKYILGDSDVDVNGVLQLPYQGENDANLIRYQGTTDINGVSADRRGRDVVIHFTNSCRVNHASASVSAVEKIYLPGATFIDTTAFSMLHLVSDNNGYITVSYSDN